MKIKDTLFYKIVKPILVVLFYLLFRPKVIGREHIPKKGKVLLAGNHTKWLDPVMLVAVQPRILHFLAKDELFHGITKWIVKGMGCVPVNRRIHDKNALKGAIDFLNKDLTVAIFPEGTINRTKEVIMPFKIGAVKACKETSSPLVPFVITGKYKLFRRGIQIEFLKPLTIKKDLDTENEKFMNIIKEKLIEGESYERKNDRL